MSNQFLLVALLSVIAEAGASPGIAFSDTDLNRIINGSEMPAANMPAVMQYRADGGCTATLVGPRVILTAAHCLPDSGPMVAHVKVKSRWVRAKLTASPSYNPNAVDSHDIALGVLDEEISGKEVRPISISRDALRWGDWITVMGFGCSSSSGSDYGTLRTGTNVVRSVATHTFNYGGAFLAPVRSLTCPGDSGGPSMVNDNGTPFIVGVHSRSNRVSRSIDVRLDQALTQQFIRQFAIQNRVEICGQTVQCDY